MTSASVFTSSESQERWMDQMRQDYFSKQDISPCVLQVPESLRDTKPQAYAPQMVGLGPYHHFRREVQQMESRKRATVKFYLERYEVRDPFEICPENFEHKIRSSYGGYLDLETKILEWVGAVDSLFLLYFMSTYSDDSKEEKHNLHPNIGALVPDIMMLENQIPIILMREMLKALHRSADNSLYIELIENIHNFCEKQSPLKFTKDSIIKCDAFDLDNHMLHYMYVLIVENQSNTDDNYSQGRKDCGSSQGQTDSTSRVGRLAKEIWVQAGELAKEIGLLVGEIFGQAIVEFNTALAGAKLAGLKVPGNVEKVSGVLRYFQQTLHLDHMKGSLGHQIDMPSACRLNAILKLNFMPLPDNCGVGDIKLQDKTLHLPVITLNSNSEIILRNLLAYESTSKKQPTKLRDYMDLICGIIKSEKDVNLLSKKGIIQGNLHDADILRMCNEIKKSNEMLHENSKVNEFVEDVNYAFNNAGIVKACRITMKCFATLVKYIFPILVLLFLALQTFCQMYDCRRSSYGGAALRNSYLGELELDPKAKLMLPRKVFGY